MTTKLIAACSSLLLLLAASGCDNSKPAESDEQLKSKIQELSGLYQQTQAELKGLKENLAGEAKPDSNPQALLKVGASTQAFVPSSVGSLVFELGTLQATEKNLNVRLAISNPLLASFAGTSFTLEYGSLNADSSVIESSKKSKNVVLSKRLPAGTTTQIAVNLEDLPGTKVDYFLVTDLKFERLEFGTSKR